MKAEEVLERIDRCTKPLVFYNREGYLNTVLWKRVTDNYWHKTVPFCTLIWDGEFIKIEHKIPVGPDGGTQTQVTYFPAGHEVVLPSYLKAAYYYHRGVQWHSLLGLSRQRRAEERIEERDEAQNSES